MATVEQRAPTILTVYPHPDDESFGPAAALALYARRGSPIYGLFFTRGEAGAAVREPAPPPAELAELRERDLREACALIGYADIELLDYPDGSLADRPPGDLEARVLDAIRRRRPTVVLTFGPGGITRHLDHLAVSTATTAAFQRARDEGLGVAALFYDAVPAEIARGRGLEALPDGRPNTLIDVRDTQAVKLAALRLHARSVADAGKMVERLERDPRTSALFYRAWPPVPPGTTLNGFATGPIGGSTEVDEAGSAL
jgi:LmbE family N-acetylglucosaminyl deacetylase